MTMGARERIAEAPMSGFQLRAIAICWLINVLDGFDVLAISFAAPAIADEWPLAAGRLGVVFSAGLVGMTVGAALLSPIADRIGRRHTILICLVLIAVGMAATGLAGDVMSLIGWRVLTGLGIGGMLPSINTMVAEYASDRRRTLAISCMQLGFPIGATVGGAIAALVIDEVGWRPLFTWGGGLTVLMIPVVLAWLPESLHFLIERRPENALAKLNDTLARMGQPKLDALPDVDDTTARHSPARLLFVPAMRRATLSLWTAFFMEMLAFYFLVSWTPKWLVDAGYDAAEGISGGVLLNVGGIFGIVLLGVLSGSVALPRIVRAYALACALGISAFALAGLDLVGLLAVAFAIGFVAHGTMIGLYASAARLYPAAARNTGTGWAVGIGRLGAALGPFAAGLLLDAGLAPASVFLLFALPMVVVAIAIGGLSSR